MGGTGSPWLPEAEKHNWNISKYTTGILWQQKCKVHLHFSEGVKESQRVALAEKLYFIPGHQTAAGRNTPTHTFNKACKMLFRDELWIVGWEWTGRKCAHRQRWQPVSSHVDRNVCSAERRRYYFCLIGLAHVQERDAQNLCKQRPTYTRSCLFFHFLFFPDTITIFMWNFLNLVMILF